MRRAQKNPQKARHKRHPRRDRRAQRRRPQRRQPTRLLPRPEKSHELQHHNQRPGRRLRQPQPVEHLRRREPAVVLHRLLRDVGEDRIRPAKRHHRRLAEENPLAHEHAVPPEPQPDRDHWRSPQHATPREHLPRPPPRRLHVPFARLVIIDHRPHPHRCFLPSAARAMPFHHIENVLPLRPTHPAHHQRPHHNHRKRHVPHKDRPERHRRDAPHHAIFKRLLPNPQHRRNHHRQHRRLESVKHRRDPTHAAIRDINITQPPQNPRRRQHEQRPRHDPAPRAVQQPPAINRQLLRLRPRQ